MIDYAAKYEERALRDWNVIMSAKNGDMILISGTDAPCINLGAAKDRHPATFEPLDTE